MSPDSEIQIDRLSTLLPEAFGTWIPTFMAREYSLAEDWRPRTNGDVAIGRAREREVGGEPGVVM